MYPFVFKLVGARQRGDDDWHTHTHRYTHSHFQYLCVQQDLVSLLHVHNQSRPKQNTGTARQRHSSDPNAFIKTSPFFSPLPSTSTLLQPTPPFSITPHLACCVLLHLVSLLQSLFVPLYMSPFSCLLLHTENGCWERNYLIHHVNCLQVKIWVIWLFEGRLRRHIVQMSKCPIWQKSDK